MYSPLALVSNSAIGVFGPREIDIMTNSLFYLHTSHLSDLAYLWYVCESLTADLKMTVLKKFTRDDEIALL